MQDLIISMVRFTAAVTLYGIEQIQTASYVTQGGQDLFKVLDKFEVAFNSLTEALVDKIDESKRNTLKSVTSMAEDVVTKSFQGLNMMDPRAVIRMTGDFWRNSSDAMSDAMNDWFGEPAPPESEPKPVADVLV